MTFKIWDVDNPMHLKGVLPLFQTDTSFTNTELIRITPKVGLSNHIRRIGHLTQSWYILGILDRVKDEKQAYRYRISEFGSYILNTLQFSPSLTIDFLHWAWYSAWLRSPNFEWGWSWTYQTTCNAMWESSSGQVIPKKLAADTLEKANLQFPTEAPAFNIQSIRNVMTWLSAMEPPFLIKKDETQTGGSWLSRKRESCSPELLFLAIQLQYQTKGLPFGTPLLIDDEIIEAVSKVCLLASEQFWPMVELCGLTFASLTRKETSYGTSLTVTELAPFTPPEPRSLKSTSDMEEYE